MKKNKKGIDAKPAKRLTSSSSSSGGVRAANEANPHRVKEERFPPAAVQTMPLNQAAVTLTGGRGWSQSRSCGGSGWAGGRGTSASHCFCSLSFFSPPPLSIRRLRLLSAVASLCRRINGAPFRIYLSNYFQELRTDKFALSCAVFAAEPPLPAMKGGSF